MDIDEVCRMAVRKGASDLHFKVGHPPVLRVRGNLEPLKQMPKLTKESLGKAAWNMMSQAQRERFKAEPDLDLAYKVEGVGRFRVNIFRQRSAIGMVLRTIPNDVKTIDELGLPQVLKQVALEPRGLILVTGTTGSGKSTTLASLIEEVNRSLPHHILTIEDPIEFAFRDRRSIINQREIGSDSSTFASALRAALRQDPDVILVGELRDKETVEIALQAAETGHLVLGTMHTLDAPESINRVVGFFEPHHQQHVRWQLAGTLRAVLSQRLIPSKAGGRVAAVEVMLNKGAVAECIADPERVREIPDHIAKGSQVYGTQTFDQAVYALLKRDVISEADALRSVNNPDELSLKIRGISDDQPW